VIDDEEGSTAMIDGAVWLVKKRINLLFHFSDKECRKN